MTQKYEWHGAYTNDTERVQKGSLHSFSEIVVYLPKSPFELDEKLIKFASMTLDEDRGKTLYQMDLAV